MCLAITFKLRMKLLFSCKMSCFILCWFVIQCASLPQPAVLSFQFYPSLCEKKKKKGTRVWILSIYPVSDRALRAKSCPLYSCPTALRVFFSGCWTLQAGILRPLSGFVVVLRGYCFHKVPTHSVLIVFQQNCSSSGICPVSFHYILHSRGRAQ